MGWFVCVAALALAGCPAATPEPGPAFCYIHTGSLAGTASFTRQDASGASVGLTPATFAIDVAADCTAAATIGASCALALTPISNVEDYNATGTISTYQLEAAPCVLPSAAGQAALASAAGQLTIASQYAPPDDPSPQSGTVVLAGQTADAPPAVYRWELVGGP